MALRTQILDKEAELSSREEYIFQLESVSEELEKYEEEISKIEIAIPEESDIPHLLESLQSMASQSGVVLKELGGFSTASPKEGRAFKEDSLDFEIAGSYQSLLEFLSRIENSARMIRVFSLSLDQPEEGEIFSFSLVIRVQSQN